MSAGRGSESDGRPRGREAVREALLEAALALMAERGPAKVPLRDIAERAGVNFGLVYQYVGTRDDVLREVYQRAAAKSAIRFEDIAGLDDAIALMMSLPDEHQVGRMIGWAALEGAYPSDVLGRSPALEHVARLVENESGRREGSEADDDARLFAAFMLVVALGWRLFRPIGLTSAGLDPSAPNDYDERLTSWLQQLARVALDGDDAPAE